VTEVSPALCFQGRSWVFPDANVNTDLMMPSRAYRQELADQATMVFSANRPGWAALVQQGDIIVGGRNFGTGSGRPVGRILKHLGVVAVVSESMNDLFMRNSFNWGIAAVECPGVLDIVEEGDGISLDLVAGTLTNAESGRQLPVPPVPPQLRAVLEAGGLFQRVQREGFIDWSG
jgi:3-isopropylmalate/(R)-2-methylmalate dehydratase small subunit